MSHPYINPYVTGVVYTDAMSEGHWQTEVMGPVTSAADTATENFYGTVDSQGRVASIYPSIARTAAPTPYPIYTRGTPGVAIMLNVTAISGGNSLTVSINGQDPGSLTYYPLLVSGAITTTGITRMVVAPGSQGLSAGAWSTPPSQVSNHPSNPAAAADVLMTVPAGQRWTAQTFTATLTTSATVANRVVTLIIDDGTNTVWQSAASTAQTATQVVPYSYQLPSTLVLQPGWRIRTSTTGLSAGDQWSAIDAAYGLSTLSANPPALFVDTVIADTMQVVMTHGNGTSVTYSVGADWE